MDRIAKSEAEMSEVRIISRLPGDAPEFSFPFVTEEAGASVHCVPSQEAGNEAWTRLRIVLLHFGARYWIYVLKSSSPS